MTKTKRDIQNLPIDKNDKEIKEYINYLYFDMFLPWKPKLLMELFIMAEHQQDYAIIKHFNEDCVHTIYVDPQKSSSQ